jgi:hypothetical protein
MSHNYNENLTPEENHQRAIALVTTPKKAGIIPHCIKELAAETAALIAMAFLIVLIFVAPVVLIAGLLLLITAKIR